MVTGSDRDGDKDYVHSVVRWLAQGSAYWVPMRSELRD